MAILVSLGHCRAAKLDTNRWLSLPSLCQHSGLCVFIKCWAGLTGSQAPELPGQPLPPTLLPAELCWLH